MGCRTSYLSWLPKPCGTGDKSGGGDVNSCAPVWIAPAITGSITVVGMFAAYLTAELVGRRNRNAERRKRRVDRAAESCDRLEAAYANYRVTGDETAATGHELAAASRAFARAIEGCDDRWVRERANAYSNALRTYYLLFGQPRDPLDEDHAAPNVSALITRSAQFSAALRAYEERG